MANITLRGVVAAGDRRVVLDGVDLDIRDGEVTALLGAADCGKLTLLKAIAGIVKIAAGEVTIDGRAVDKLKAGRRNVAMVFQPPSLLPHKSVFDNIAFPLRMAKRASAAIERDVRAAAARCGVADVLDKKPKKLTEEQRRRVDLARALVRQPGAYLIQPPSGKNAEEGRAWMRRQIVQLHREQDATIIYATEDKAEALRLADRIVLMDAGTVRQVGAPAALLDRPANLFVAKYFGAPPMNLLAAVITATGEAGVTVRLSGGETLTLPLAPGVGLVGEHVTLGVRANHVTLGAQTKSDTALVEAKLQNIEQKRGKTRLRTQSEAGLLRAVVPGEVAAKPGDIVSLALPLARCHLFDDAGEAFKPRPDA